MVAEVTNQPMKFVAGTPKYWPGVYQCHRLSENLGSKDMSSRTIRKAETT